MDRGLGYLHDPEDARDHLFASLRSADDPRVFEVRFDEHCPLTRDQGRKSSCVGNAGAAAVETRRSLDGQNRVDLSEDAAYWAARARSGLHLEDGGAYIRDFCYVAHRYGIPMRDLYPPVPIERINEQPDIAADVSGYAFALGVYERIQGTGAARVEAVLDALQERCPVLFGTDLSERFVRCRDDETIPAPTWEEANKGGHAMVALGYTDWGSKILWKNSWGPDFGFEEDGIAGLCWVEAEWYARVFTRDIWVLRPASRIARRLV